MRFFKYETPNETAGQSPIVSTINLDTVVAVKPNGDNSRLVVQFDGAKGILLPFDAAARDALIAEWTRQFAGLVATYQFADPDRDDVLTTFAWVRLDKIKAVVRHNLDPQFVIIQTTARRSMVVPFKRVALDGLVNAWTNLAATAS